MKTPSTVLVSWRLPPALYDRARGAAFTLGVPASQLVREALEARLADLEAAHGGPFPTPGNAKKSADTATSDNAPLTK